MAHITIKIWTKHMPSRNEAHAILESTLIETERQGPDPVQAALEYSNGSAGLFHPERIDWKTMK
jgi:hypothetical protein